LSDENILENSTKDLYIYSCIYLYAGETMSDTTIRINEETKLDLDTFREYKNESYDEVIKKVLYIVRKARTEPKLSKEAIIQIEKARERIKNGNFVTAEEAKRRLGL
jgi:hypothetical protein